MAAYTPKYSRKPSGRKGIGRFIPWIPLQRIKKSSTVANPQAGLVGGRQEKQARRLSRTGLPAFVLCVLVGTGGWFSYRLLVASNIFRLTEISVIGNRSVRDRQIVEATGLTQGTNLLGFDVATAETKAQALSWVDQLDIQIAWPSRVVINVREHQPLALVTLEGDKGRQLHYIDKDGTVFAQVIPGQDIDFPVITGRLADSGLEGDQIAVGTPAAGALRFLQLAARGNAILPVQAVSEVHVDPELGLIVYLVDRPFPIYMGENRIRTKYYRLVKILERLYRKKQIEGIKEIRMDYTENKVLVAMLQPGR
ncbi:MAG: FtsQ-type POTRA domain-containing protein [Desulfobulbaceae bacterium]|nr:FtsQ-type POTRA domain-containing protein [Desulfobulbaceae bacterium]